LIFFDPIRYNENLEDDLKRGHMSQGKVEEKESPGIEAKIDEMLIAERKICLFSQVDDKSAKEIIRKLW
jgi:hypothetical protein